MFGKNERLPRIVDSGVSLRVVQGSPFYTIQGEGPFAGRPAVFIRLHGCHLACHFCDTKFDDPADPEVNYIDIANKALDVAELGQSPSPAGKKCKLAVITGGEPARQNLDLLIRALYRNADGFNTIQIETAGNFWQPCFEHDAVRIVVSPKTGSVHDMIRRHAFAWKYIIRSGETCNLDGLPIRSTQIEGQHLRLARPSGPAPVYLSPCDEYNEERNAVNRHLVAQLAMRHGYIAGIQTHKLFQVD